MHRAPLSLLLLLIYHNPPAADMVNQFVTLERGEQGDVELVGEGRFGQGGLQSVDVGTRKVFARQCDVHVGKRLVVPFGPRAVEDDLPDVPIGAEQLVQFLQFRFL